MATRDKDAIQILLAARAGAYRLLQTIIGNEPSEELLQQLGDGPTQTVLDVFRDNQDIYDQSLDSFTARVAECQDDLADATRRLNSGFTFLFVGPGQVEAPPWESFYLGTSIALFQKKTLEVRKAYIAEGFIAQKYPNVSDDHIGIELDFIAKLAERAEQYFASDDLIGVRNVLHASSLFLKDHLSLWAPLFAARVKSAKHGFFYREAAALLDAFIVIDLGLLDELITALD